MPVEIFSSTEFWTSLLVALIGGGGVGAIIGAVSGRRKDTADIAAQACDILTDSVINPLREQVDEQEGQIEHLEKQQRKNFALTAQPGVAPKLANIPADFESRLIKMDFNEAAANRDRTLAEWSRRYDAKSEAKK